MNESSSRQAPLPPSAAGDGSPPSPPAAWLKRLGRIPAVKPAEVQEWWDDRVPLVLPPQAGLILLQSWEREVGQGTSPMIDWLRSTCQGPSAFTFNALWKEKRGGRLYPYFLPGYEGPVTISKYAYQKSSQGGSRLLLSSIRRDVRAALAAPPPWKLISADFTSCHGYISYALSGDVQLAKDLAAGFHETTGAWLLSDEAGPTLRREVGKKMNNAMTFGLGVGGLQRVLAPVLGEAVPADWAEAAWTQWWERYPELREFRDSVAWGVTWAQSRSRRLAFNSPSGWPSSFTPSEVQGKIVHGRPDEAPGPEGAQRAVFSAIFRAVESDLLDQTVRHFHSIREHHGARLMLPLYDGLLVAAPYDSIDLSARALQTCAEAAGSDLGIPGLSLTTKSAGG